MSHPPEELLVQHALGLTNLADHLDSCTACTGQVQEIVAVQREAPLRALPSDLVAIGRQRAREEQQAVALVESVPVERLADALDDPLLRTPGAIGVILERVPDLRRHDPPAALAVVTRLREGAGTLPVELQVDVLREAASTKRAFGDYAHARELLSEAERIAQDLVVTDIPIARLWYERARVEVEDSNDGSRWSEAASHVFFRYGDELRYHRARYLTAVSHYNQRRYRSVIEELEKLLPRLEETNDQGTLALCCSVLGFAAVQENELARAEEFFLRALALFEKLDWPIEIARAQWGMARVLLKTGLAAESVALAEEVRSEFQRRGLWEESGLAALDIVEALILIGDHPRADAVCREAIATLSDRMKSADQQRALSFLRETALTVSAIQVVSEYLHASRTEPERIFVPPPS